MLDALNCTLRGVSALLQTPKPKVSIKSSDLNTVEYEMSAFVGADSSSSEVRNLLFDLAYRHLQAAGILSGAVLPDAPRSRQRALLDDVKIFRTLNDDERIDWPNCWWRNTFQ